jgi:hypothetical protein
MGQQQLLLIILVVLIVGIATLVATNVISKGAVQYNRDAVRQDLITAASSVQYIWERPTVLGGAGWDFQSQYTDERLAEDIDITGTITGTTIINENATYSISTTNGTTVVITAIPEAGGNNMSITIEKDETDGWLFTLNDGIQIVTNQPDD